MRALSAVLCFLLVSNGAQCKAQTPPAGWLKLDAGPFSIFAPSGWEFHQLVAVDSYVGEFVGDGVVLRFDFGGYPNPLKEEKKPVYVVVHESIGGFRAKIVSPTVPGNGLTAIYFRNVGGANALCFWGQDLTSVQQELALKIFDTIRFGGSVPRFVVPPPPDKDSKASSLVVSLPKGEVSRIPSPDGKWTLIFECPNDCSERKLWVEEASSRARKLIRDYERGLDISWGPDSRLFFVNDNSGSTDARCYVYEAATVKETDIAKLVLAGDPHAEQFLNSGHSYLRAKQWLSSHELLVVLTGHNDGLPPGAFTLRYRVDLNGRVQKLSQNSEEQQ